MTDSPSTRKKAPVRMAGYKRKAKVYKLIFEDEEFAGLEVRVKSLPVGDFLDLTDLADVAAGTAGAEQKDKIERLFAIFADALLDWNLLDEDDNPVPANLDGVKSQDLDFDLTVIKAWMEAVAGVAAPLVTGSNGGTTTLEASLPMAPLTPSPESSETPS